MKAKKNTEIALPTNSTTVRITDYQKARLVQLGGSPQKGIALLLDFYDRMQERPEDILMKPIVEFMDLLKIHYPDNHYQHFEKFPAFVRMSLKRGRLIPEVLGDAIRPEKKLHEFKVEE